MYSKSERLLILRFIFSKKSDGYISLFSWFSIIGTAIGVAAIIIVMSVMNGFRSDLTKRLLGINSHLNVYSNINIINSDQVDQLYKEIKKNNYVSSYPSLEINALLTINDKSKGVLIRGYDVIEKKHILFNNLIAGNLINNSNDEVIIGDYLAIFLGIQLGDKIKIVIPKTDKTLLGNVPRFKSLKVVGIFDFGMHEYDSNLIYVSGNLIRKLLSLDNDTYNKIEFFIQEPMEVDEFKFKLTNLFKLNEWDLFAYSWKDRNSTLINALNIEKNVMFLILSLIIFVASMNIISGLIIFVKEKNKDIGILKTIGLSNYSIIKIFFSIGITIGFMGSSLGVLIGVIFSNNIKLIQSFLENLLNTKLFAEEIYYLSSLPSEIKVEEVIFIFFISIMISFLSTIFPAIRSSNVDPIKSIREE